MSSSMTPDGTRSASGARRRAARRSLLGLVALSFYVAFIVDVGEQGLNR